MKMEFDALGAMESCEACSAAGMLVGAVDSGCNWAICGIPGRER